MFKRFQDFGLLTLFAIAYSFSAHAPTQAQSFTMKPLADIAAAEPQIIGGRKSNAADWSATFAFSNCTSTAIGARVLLTAAHCIADGASGILEIGNMKIELECDHHPSYSASTTPPVGKTTSADWALCVAKSHDVPARAYETINLSPARIKTGTEILLTGFGCNKQGGLDGNYGVQYEGEAIVKAVKDATEPDGLPKPNNKPWALHYVTTSGGAAVCYGDSGGAAYLYLDLAKQSRVVIGVNSRGDISKVSYLSATSDGAFEKWAKTWAASWEQKLQIKGIAICGIHATNSDCHP